MGEDARTPKSGSFVIGTVVAVHGTAKAVSIDGIVRVLALNCEIYANDEWILTESDGTASIRFNGPPAQQVSLGRMAKIRLATTAVS